MIDLNPPAPLEGAPDGLLLCRDLIFTSKITGTARALGLRVQTVGRIDLASASLDRWRPKVVFVDLSAGDLAAPEALLAYRKAAPESTFIAFGSHVDTQALAAAEAAGCDRVLPRSRFTIELPEILRKLLGEAPAAPG